MKTIEQKAKAYDEAINRMKHYVVDEYGCSRIKVADVFPDLEVSENIRIIKAIKYGLDHVFTNNTTVFEVTKEQCLAWLEKQGEHANFLSKIQVGDKVTRNEAGVLVNISQLERVAKPRRDKPADKAEPKFDDVEEVNFFDDFRKTDSGVEPKFKKGDWVIIDGETLHITNVIEDGYSTEEGGYIPFRCEKDARLWTVQDAKDSDVLALNNETIVIFKDLYSSTTFHTYCYVKEGTFSVSRDDIPDWWNSEGFYPATKEQRDLLFQKMKEAGYDWDAEKKELKKIEQKPVEHLELKSGHWYICYRAYCCRADHLTFKEGEKVLCEEDGVIKGFIIKNAEKYFKEIRKPTSFENEQKPIIWGEEDDRKLGAAIDLVNFTSEIWSKQYQQEYIDWLKSLKDRYTWKPSDEQMDALNDVISSRDIKYDVLSELWKELKKLKEE